MDRDRIIRYLVVTAVTVVVWLWAADEQSLQRIVTTRVNVSVPEELATERELLSPSEPFPVDVELRGSASELSRAERRLRNVEICAGEGGVPDGISQRRMEMADILQAILDDEEYRVTVVRIDGVVPFVDVDTLERVVVPVAPVLPGAKIDGDPVVEPAQVEVRLPRKLLERAGSIRVEAVVDRELLEGRESGRRYTEAAPLRVRPKNPVDLGNREHLSHETANVTFTLAARTTTATVGAESSTSPGVPVQVALPPRDLDRYEVAIDEKDSFLRNVEITGPTEQIDQVKQGRFKILAFVQLSSDDLDRAVLEGGSLVKPVTLWSLPPGVTVTNPGQTDYQLERQRNRELPPRSGILVTVRPRS